MDKAEDTKVMCMFVLGMNIKQRLLEQCLKTNSTTLETLLTENPEAFEKVVNINDFQSCLSQISLSEIEPHHLGLTSLNTIFSALCGKLFWDACLKEETFENYLNSNKHLIYHLYKYMERCCLTGCEKYLSDENNKNTITEAEWRGLFGMQTSPCKDICSGICERVAVGDIKTTDINTDLTRRLLLALSTIFISAEHITRFHGQICRQPMDIQILNFEYDEMKIHIKNIAEFCDIGEYVSSKLNEFERRTLQTTDYMKTRKAILYNALANPDVIKDRTLHEKVKDEHTDVQRYLNKEEVGKAIQCKTVTLNIINGEYAQGQLKSQIVTTEEPATITTDTIHLTDTNEDSSDKGNDNSFAESRICCLERTNAIRLYKLITQFGQKAFLIFLKSRMPGVTSNAKFFDGMKDRLKVVLNNQEKQLLFPSRGTYQGDLTDLDISILYKVLRNLNTIPPPNNGWGNPLEPAEKGIAACIERIRVAKNKFVSHNAEGRITNDDFYTLWKEIKESIVTLSYGRYAGDIDELLCSPINTVADESNIERLKETRVTCCMHDYYTCGNCSGKTDSLIKFIVSGRTNQQNTSQTKTLHLNSNATLTIKIENGQEISVEEVNRKKNLLNNQHVTTVKAESGCIMLWLRLNKATFNSVEQFVAIMEDYLQIFITNFLAQSLASSNEIQISFKFIEPDNMFLKEDRFNCGDCGHCFDTFAMYADHKSTIGSNFISMEQNDAMDIDENNTKNKKTVSNDTTAELLRRNARKRTMEMAVTSFDSSKIKKPKQSAKKTSRHISTSKMAKILPTGLTCSAAATNVAKDIETSANKITMSEADLVTCARGNERTDTLLINAKGDENGYEKIGLHAACAKGYNERVTALMNTGNDVNKYGETPLYTACSKGDDTVQVLLEEGADVYQTGKYGITPLYAVCKGRHENIVQVLIDKGADINKTDRYGNTPLYVACERGHEKIVQLLIDKGAAINWTGKYGSIPLSAACEGGHDKIVQVLIDKGADINRTCIDGYTPLYAACKGGHEKIVQLLIDKGTAINWTDRYGKTPLYAACERGHEKIVQLVIDGGADINRTCEDGNTPLYAACGRGYEKIVQLLIDKKADINLTGRHGNTPLYAACKGGHEKIVELLIDKGTVINQTDRYGNTLLYAACGRGYEKIVQLVIDRGADINRTCEDGNTPLYAACWRGYEKIVQLLIDKGADINRTGRHENTPLYAACKGGHEKIVELLIDKGAVINQTDRYGNTPLYAACERGYEKIVQLVIDKGADINKTDKSGNTSLSAACERGHEKIARLLIDKGADVNRCARGKIPILYVACENRHDQIVKLLIAKGAVIHMEYISNHFNFGFRLPGKRSFEETLQILKDKGAVIPKKILHSIKAKFRSHGEIKLPSDADICHKHYKQDNTPVIKTFVRRHQRERPIVTDVDIVKMPKKPINAKPMKNYKKDV